MPSADEAVFSSQEEVIILTLTELILVLNLVVDIIALLLVNSKK